MSLSFLVFDRVEVVSVPLGYCKRCPAILGDLLLVYTKKKFLTPSPALPLWQLGYVSVH